MLNRIENNIYFTDANLRFWIQVLDKIFKNEIKEKYLQKIFWLTY